MPKDPNEPCGTDEFQCLSGGQCIPLAYQCDQEIDCFDRSDEISCGKFYLYTLDIVLGTGYLFDTSKIMYEQLFQSFT